MPDAPQIAGSISPADRGMRATVLDAAVAILGGQGLKTGFLEQAAEAAGCPIGRARLWFSCDEDLILALYMRLATELEARVPELPEGTLAERFEALMQAKLRLVAPYREAFAALLASLLDPRSPIGVLSDATEIVRARVMGTFAAAVHGASDRPGDEAAPALIRALYGAHLALLLVWTQDRSPESAAAQSGLDMAKGLLAMAGPFLAMPDAVEAIAKADTVFGPLIAPAPDADATALSERILRILFRHRRLAPDAGDCALNPCPQCLALHLPRVRRSVLAGQPIHLLLPAFPAKSPSLDKVLGSLPDMAEELAIQYLQGVCAEIASVYPPAALRDLWGRTEITYSTEKLAHYGGSFTAAMIGKHQETGEDVLRFAEPVNDLNPVSLVISGVDDSRRAELLGDLRERLRSPELCYAHVWREGDYLIADNHALLHGRNAFKTPELRHIRRVNVL